MKKIGVILLMLLFLATAVYAQDFAATLIPFTELIKQNETAVYRLIISHPFSNPHTFEIYSTDILWDIRTKDSLVVPPGQGFETELYVRPLNLNPGTYSIPLNIKLTGTDQIILEHLPLEVTSQFPPTDVYLPAIRGTVMMNRKADPKDPVNIYVRLENQNKKLLKNLQVKLRSNVINKDYDVELRPQEAKKLTFEALIDPYTPPQVDIMKVTVVAIEDDKVYQFDLEPVEYTIIDYSDLIEEIYESKQTFKIVREIILKNEGNLDFKENYRQTTNFLENLFTTSIPKSHRLGHYRIWELDIPKGGVQKIHVVINYRPLVFLIAAFIVLIIAYIVFRSPIVMNKKAAVVGTREGGISELKVLLTVKNRTNKTVKHLKIIDLIPRIAAFKQDSEIGTVTPDQIMQSELKGTLLKWHIDQIDPREERLISYKIRSKLSILGGVTLPVTVAKFKTERGKTRHSNSNKAKIGFLG